MIIGVSGKIGSGKDTIYKIINYLINEEEHGVIAPYSECLKYNSNFLDKPFKNKKFADKLKDIVCLLIGCTRKQLEDQDFKNKELGEEWKIAKVTDQPYDKKGWLINHKDFSLKKYYLLEEYILTPRKLLQLLGTECGRNVIHPNIWINSLFANYKKAAAQACPLGLVKNNESSWVITDVRFENEAKAIKDRDGLLIRVNRDYDIVPDANNKPMKVKKLHYVHESETALDNYKDWDYLIDNNSNIEDLIEKVKDILIKEKII